MSTNPRKENWQKPLWKHIVHQLTHPEHTQLTNKKSIVVELADNRLDIVVGKIVSGGANAGITPRDRALGKRRRIWGVLFRVWWKDVFAS